MLDHLPDRIAVFPPRLEAWWARARSTLWFLPALAVVLAVALSTVVVWVDNRLDPDLARTSSPWLFGAGADGARGVLSAIAGSLVTVIGTVFSITIVGLQLASSQFTPTVMRQFTSNRINQAVLAVYIGTFTYSLLVLRSVRSEAEGGAGFVPVIGVTLGILLALACVAMLIVFIHGIAQQLQVSNILAWSARATLEEADRLYPMNPQAASTLTQVGPEPGDGIDILADRAGYVQHLDLDTLLALARRHDATVRLLVAMGGWVNAHQVIARVWSAEPSDEWHEAAEDSVRASLVLGAERTTDADVAQGMRQIADIGIKALSFSINDPTTATKALNRVGQILSLVGSRCAPVRIHEAEGRPALYHPVIDFDDLIAIGLTQIRHYGKRDLVVLLHMAGTIERVAAVVNPLHRPTLLRHLALTSESGTSGLELPRERERLAAEVEAATQRIESGEFARTGTVVDWATQCSE